jgi:glycosyltransferase involved in cell wall biosynthesis
MSNKLFIDKSAKSTTKKEGYPCRRDKATQNTTVVLPTCNEEDSIGSTILLTRLYADNVIVVDDGSSDRTGDIAKKAGATVIVHVTSKGKSAALETGTEAAIKLGADIIVTMGSQGQHDPEDIPKLITPIAKGSADIVNGSRYLNELGKKVSIYRRVGQTILDKFTNLNSDLRITDPQSGFLAFSASAKNNFQFISQGLEIESDIFSKAEKSGLRIKEVEIGTSHKLENPARNPIKYALGILEAVVKDIEVNKPLYFYSVPGFALATCALYMGFRFLEAFLLGFRSLHFGPAFLMVFLAFAGAYMTIKGIVIHSLEETAQTEPAI